MLSEHDGKFIGLSQPSLGEEGFCCHQIKFKETVGGPAKLGNAPTSGAIDNRQTESSILFTILVSCFSSEPVLRDFNLIRILAVSKTCSAIS